jgi:hypothetical protein
MVTVAGRIREEHNETLRTLLEQEVVPSVLDLQNVILIDREAVVFLASIEVRGCELRNCPPYIREWVTREREKGAGRRIPSEVPKVGKYARLRIRCLVRTAAGSAIALHV